MPRPYETFEYSNRCGFCRGGFFLLLIEEHMEKQFASWQDFVDTEVKSLWKSINTTGPSYRKTMGTPPDVFHVLRFEEADWKEGLCKGRVLEGRLYSGNEFENLDVDAQQDVGERRDAFWQKALIRYCFDEETNSLFFEEILGPRFGCGTIYTFRVGQPTRIIDGKVVWRS